MMMLRCGYLVALAVVAASAAVAPGQAPRAQEPLTEAKIVRMIELKVKDPVIVSMIKKQGVGFAVDDEAIARLKKAGSSESVLEALRQRAAPNPRAGPGATGDDNPITFDDIRELLQLGVPEAEILDRLGRSPTTFTLSKEQVADLKKLGATEPILKAMSSVRTAVDAASELSNLAIVLDCSGSMSEQTPDGRTKMDAGKEAAIGLVREVPAGIRLAFVVYGHDRAKECNAVEAIRPLGVLDSSGKDELIGSIRRLKPVGSTPIALALNRAGRELSRAKGAAGVVLISDGKEMCGGDPASAAAELARQLKLDSGIQVVGFGVKPDERESLEVIARAGKGKYYDAPTPAVLRDVVPLIARKIQEEAKPAPEGMRIAANRRPPARFITVRAPSIRMPAVENFFLTEQESNSGHALPYHARAIGEGYDRKFRINPTCKETIFDLWWIPKDDRIQSVKLVANLEIPLEQAETIVKPEEYVGMVRLSGKGLPAAKLVFLGPPDYGAEVAKSIHPHIIQKASKYGEDLIVPAGTYNLWIDPADSEDPEVVAEKIEVKAGEVTVVD